MDMVYEMDLRDFNACKWVEEMFKKIAEIEAEAKEAEAEIEE